jgi:hypothetical protein
MVDQTMLSVGPLAAACGAQPFRGTGGQAPLTPVGSRPAGTRRPRRPTSSAPPANILGRLLSATINRALDYRRGHF